MEHHQNMQPVLRQIPNAESTHSPEQRRVALPQNVSVTKDLPDTPRTTVSAIIGPDPVLEQESASRAAAEGLRAQAQAEINEKFQNNDNSDKSAFNLKTAFKTLNPNKKKAKHANANQSISINKDKDRDASEKAYDQCRGVYVKTSFPQVVREKSNISNYANPTGQQFLNSNFNAYHNSGGFGTYCMNTPQFHFFPPLMQQQAHYNQAYPQDYSIALGGQIPEPNTNRLPSTFITPTNANTYAVAGHSRLVSGHNVVSQHAEIHNLLPQAPNTKTPFIFDIGQAITSAAKTENDGIKEPKPNTNDGQTIPGVPFSMEYLDAHLNHPGHRNTTKERTALADRELRRSASVPLGLMMRGSAVPAPLEIKKKEAERGAGGEDALGKVASGTKEGGIGDDFIIAAFDGVHRHMEEVKGELEGKMRGLEEKLDRVLGLLAASAAAGAEQQKHQSQQREVRANLTGLPPHIPFGGMEGWYNAVKK